jgi:hypothetical protein
MTGRLKTARVGTNDGPLEGGNEPSDSLLAEGLFAFYKDPRHEVVVPSTPYR